MVGFRGNRKLISICGKFAVLSCGILAKWPAEFGKICRGKLWSLLITFQDCWLVLLSSCE